MKVFNLKTYRVEKIKEKQNDVVVVNRCFNADILNLPLKEMNVILAENLQIEPKATSGKKVFYNIKIAGKCNREDIADFYDYIENVITDLYCTNCEVKADQQDRLGLYGLPEINLKTMNYLQWIKFNAPIAGIGFEVGKLNSCWNKRLIK